MKKVSIIIGLLGFFTLSCATTTANTDQRKVSAINDQNTVAFNWKFWKNTKKDKTKEPTDEDIKECISKHPCVYKVAFKECSENAHQAKNILQKQGVKVASINEQNPFMLLEEVSQDAPPPLMLIDDYEECMHGCICDRGSSMGCHEVCR